MGLWANLAERPRKRFGKLDSARWLSGPINSDVMTYMPLLRNKTTLLSESLVGSNRARPFSIDITIADSSLPTHAHLHT